MEEGTKGTRDMGLVSLRIVIIDDFDRGVNQKGRILNVGRGTEGENRRKSRGWQLLWPLDFMGRWVCRSSPVVN